MQNLIFTFSRLKLLPRMMIDVSSRNMKTSVLGTEISMPIGIAPTAMQKMAHPEGECAAAKAAEKAGTLFIMSTISTSSIEEVAQAAPNALKWFQLYIYKDRQVHFLPYFFKFANFSSLSKKFFEVSTPEDKQRMPRFGGCWPHSV